MTDSIIGRRVAQYDVIEKIAQGGMGVVYKARDTRLGRIVALKSLPQDRAADPDRTRRFAIEARSASALNHPNIITIYDLAEGEGTTFIVMEYVPGGTLAEALAAGPLPFDRALAYAAQLADALDAAHFAGIVHRDLKPSNVMISDDGRVKVLDFGVAKLIETAADATATLIVGTASYMSPEQAQGGSVDARSDIYSLGAVLYEMLTGRRAFTGLDRQVSLPLGHVAPEVQAIIQRCLRGDPAERFQSASELRVALKNTASNACPTIAVLPFINLSSDKDNEYFSDGLAEEITNVLATVPGLKVTARTSAFAYRGRGMDVREIGSKLNAMYLLDGSVRKASNRIRVTAQLVNAMDGFQMWSEHYDREMTDIFKIQDEIAQAIVGKLRIRLPGGPPTAKRYTENLEAYNLYLQARYLNYNRTAETLARGAELLRQALAIDPDYPLAHLGMAEHYMVTAHQGFRMPRELLPKVKATLERALELDPSLAEAHALLGYIQACFEYDWVGGERRLKHALTLAPHSPNCLYRYAFSIRGLGHRLDEALVLARRAQESEPRSVLVNWLPALLLFFQKQYDKALEECLRVIECAPHHIAYVVLAEIYAMTGMADEAVAAAEKAADLDARSPFSVGFLGGICGLVGRADKARVLLAELNDIERRTYVPAVARAWIFAGLGEHDPAFECFNKAIDEGAPILADLAVNPLAERFRSDPRYKMVLKRMNLA